MLQQRHHPIFHPDADYTLVADALRCLRMTSTTDLLAVYITPADEQECAQVQELAQQVQQATGKTVKLAFADQGYTGEDAAAAATAEDIELQVVKLPEAKKGFVLLPRRWVVERSFGWLNRVRKLACDYKRLPETLAGLHFVVFVSSMLARAVQYF